MASAISMSCMATNVARGCPIANARTSGPAKPNPVLFTGLAGIIADGGENAARRKERFGETIGSALAGLGAMASRKKERRQDRAERQQERDYQHGRDAKMDARWAEEFKALQADRDRTYNRNVQKDVFDIMDRGHDNYVQDQRLELDRLKAKEEKGEGPSLVALANSLLQSARDKEMAGDTAGAQADMMQAGRAQQAALTKSGLGGAGGMVERPGEAQQVSEVTTGQPRGLGRGNPRAQAEREASLVPQVDFENGSDAVVLQKALDAERERTDKLIGEMPSRTPAQKAEREQARRVRDRALTIFQARVAKIAVAEKAERTQKAGEAVQAMGGNEQDVQAARLGVEAGASPNEVLGQAGTTIRSRANDKDAAKTPEKAKEYVLKIVEPDMGEASVPGGPAMGHADRLQRLRNAPESAAQAFGSVGEQVQDMIFDAVNDRDPMATAKLLSDTWARLNPRADEAEAARVGRAILAAAKRQAARRQGR